MKNRLLPTLLGSAFVLSFSVTSLRASEEWWKPYSPDAPNTTFHASWDEGQHYSDSQATTSFVTGPHLDYHWPSVEDDFGRCVRIGQPAGASLGDPSCLEYETAGRLSPEKGTIEFWYKPSVILVENRNWLTFFKSGNFWLRGDPGQGGHAWMALDIDGKRFHIKFPQEFYESDWGWHHLAMTYDFSDPAHGVVEFFIDGELISRTDSLDATGLKLGETFRIGGSDEPNFLTNGFYDEFRISDVVREFGPRP